MTPRTLSKRMPSLVLLMLLLGVAKTGRAEEAETVDVSNALAAFAHLNYYAERGAMFGIFRRGQEDTNNRSKFGELPDELAASLQPRDENLLTTETHVPWLSNNREVPRDIESTLGRLAQFGLIELFHHQNSRLLDRPLETRPALMDRLNPIVDQLKISFAGLIGEGLDQDEKLVLFANMRRLSTEFEMNILLALSPEERTRVEKLVSVAMPVAIETIQQNSKRFGPFGFEVEKK